MTKLETVQRLGDSAAPQLQIVESVRALQQTVSTLPAAVAAETAAALEPLTRLRLDVQRVLETYDAVTEIQRRSLESMAQEMSDRAAAVMEAKAAALDKTLQGQQGQMQRMQQHLQALEASSKAMQALPRQIAASAAQAAEQMQSSAGDLAQQADRARPRRWLQALGLVLAGAVGGVTAATGQVALNRLVQPSDVQERADAMQMLLERATPQERALMQQIVNRPGR